MQEVENGHGQGWLGRKPTGAGHGEAGDIFHLDCSGIMARRRAIIRKWKKKRRARHKQAGRFGENIASGWE